MENETFLRFPRGREKALTFSYDDGVAADRKLMSILDDKKMLCTFNLNSGVFGNGAHGRMTCDEQLALFSGVPHEIASHGSKHLFLTKVSEARAINDVISDKARLEQLFGKVVCGFAYAYGAFDENIKSWLPKLGIKYARTTISTHQFGFPADPMELNPTCHHTESELFDLEEQFLKTNPHDFVKEREPYLFYLWGHSYEFDENSNWHIIERFVEKASDNDDIWYATNGVIMRYHEAYLRLEFSADGTMVFNPSGVDVWLEQRGQVFCAGAWKTTRLI